MRFMTRKQKVELRKKRMVLKAQANRGLTKKFAFLPVYVEDDKEYVWLEFVYREADKVVHYYSGRSYYEQSGINYKYYARKV